MEAVVGYRALGAMFVLLICYLLVGCSNDDKRSDNPHHGPPPSPLVR